MRSTSSSGGGRTAAFRALIERSIPLALERERGPVVRRRPEPALSKLFLGVAKGRGRRQAPGEHGLVKTFHQLGRGAIRDLPEARADPRRPRVHEAPREPEKAFSAHFLSEGG